MIPEPSQDEFRGLPRAVGGPGDYQSRPRLAAPPAGDPWLAFLAREEGRPARVLVGRLGADGLGPVEEVPHSLARVHDIALAAGPGGEVLVLVSGIGAGAWALEAVTCRPAGGFGVAEVLSDPGERPVHPAAAFDASGRPVAAWESVGPGRAGIALRRGGGAAFGEAVRIAHPAGPCHRPALAAAPDGSVLVACEVFREGLFRIAAARLGSAGGPAWADDPLPEACDHLRPRVTADSRGIWIGFERWLERTVPLAQVGLSATKRPSLHGPRKVLLARLEGGRTVETRPGFSARRPGVEDPLVREILLALALDPAGRPWLFWRTLGYVQGIGDYRNWGIVASGLDGERWTPPFEMTRGEFGPSAEASVAMEPGGGFRFVWAKDERGFDEHHHFETREGPWRLWEASLKGGIRAVLSPRREMPPPAVPAYERTRWRRRGRDAIEVGGRSYLVAFGDLHRHTEISVCLRSWDTHLEEHYRYLRRALALDFVGVTDHLHHMCEEDWELSCRLAALHDVPGEFVAFPAAEFNAYDPEDPLAKVSDNNVFFLGDFEPWSAWRAFRTHSYAGLKAAAGRSGAILIPHIGLGNNLFVSEEQWAGFDGETQSVVEICQTRGSYEFLGAPRQSLLYQELGVPAIFARDALRSGRRFGFVGSGDHSGRDLTGVLCRELTREGVAEGIRRRRTYATTGIQLLLDFRVNGFPMGSAISLPKGVPLEIAARIRALAPVKEALLVVNAEEVHRWENLPPDADLRLPWDRGSDRGASIYLRVTQEDLEMAWASPVFVDRT